MLPLITLLAFPDISGKLGNLKQATEEKLANRNFETTCVAFYQDILSVQQSEGNISQENWSSYRSFSKRDSRGYLQSINLIIEPENDIIEKCASFPISTANSEKIAQQKQLVNHLYSHYLEQQMIYDQYGDGSFVVSRSHYFDDIALDTLFNHELCDINSPVDPEQKARENRTLVKIISLQEAVKNQVTMSDFQQRLDGDYQRLLAKAVKKANACGVDKVKNERVRPDRGTTAMHKKWDSRIQQAFAGYSKQKIQKIIFADADPRDVREERRETNSQGQVVVTKVSYDVWEGAVYVFNEDGKYVDAYHFGVSTNYITNKERVSFSTKSDGALELSHRVLRANFK